MTGRPVLEAEAAGELGGPERQVAIPRREPRPTNLGAGAFPPAARRPNFRTREDPTVTDDPGRNDDARLGAEPAIPRRHPELETLRDRIAANLTAFERIAIAPAGRRRAAVAIVLAPSDLGPAYLLTRRALHLRRNAGNYALPGGGLDPGEDAIDAALRETDEEVGVRLTRAAALGLLDDFVTLGEQVVTPVVLWTPDPVALSPAPEEVQAAWFVPLADLDHPRAPRRIRNPPGPPLLRMYARGSWINAPTAAWLWQFREVCLRGRPVRTDAIGQPNWTAR